MPDRLFHSVNIDRGTQGCWDLMSWEGRWRASICLGTGSGFVSRKVFGISVPLERGRSGILQPAITEEQLTIMMRSLCPKHPADQDGKDASRSWDMRDRAGACLCSHIGAGDGRATSISADAGRNPTASRWRPAIASKLGDRKLSEYGTTTDLPVWRTCYGGPKPTWLMEEMPEMRVEVGFRAEESRAPERGKDLLIGKTLEDHVPMGDDRQGDKEADGMLRQSTVVGEEDH